MHCLWCLLWFLGKQKKNKKYTCMQLFISESCLLSVPTILPLQRSDQCFLMVLLRLWKMKTLVSPARPPRLNYWVHSLIKRETSQDDIPCLFLSSHTSWYSLLRGADGGYNQSNAANVTCRFATQMLSAAISVDLFRSKLMPHHNLTSACPPLAVPEHKSWLSLTYFWRKGEVDT